MLRGQAPPRWEHAYVAWLAQVQPCAKSNVLWAGFCQARQCTTQQAPAADRLRARARLHARIAENVRAVWR
jgi:hypothetical protein